MALRMRLRDALKTNKPQKDLFHLVSRTKTRHEPVMKVKHMHRPKWVNPKDRIKWWNIAPGDKVRMISGKDEFRKKDRLEVLEVDREKNWLYLKDGPQLTRHVANLMNEPDMPKYNLEPMPVHYSNVQLYIGDFEFPPLPDETEPRVLPVYATRVQRTTPTYVKAIGRYVFRRYAAATYPALPPKYDENGNRVRIEIPWPQFVGREPADPGPQDTTAEEALKLTWVPPAPTLNPGLYKRNEPKPEDVYLQTAGADPSQPMEHFVARELSSYYSRANRTKRWQLRGPYRQARLERAIRRETKESEVYADGRTREEIVLEATWKFDRDERERHKRKRVMKLMRTPRGKKITRKIRRTMVKKLKKMDKINSIVLKPAKNQYIPPGMNVIEEVPYASAQSQETLRRAERKAKGKTKS
ncbi:hypothetical protein CALCODRAFT_479347 [Calocera cornea HHB12733]|uniref:KOW domain-containing protein n=1 Tax=Calocera cornea HHB12733 TaxID=1353952 RepID=A0A165JQS0_9BASI|nr:hypothetical protein CALCODRAFT_479347 [Calocera cornea HHB12733]